MTPLSIPERARDAHRERYARRTAERFLKSATLQCYRLEGDTLELAKVIIEVMQTERERCIRELRTSLVGEDEHNSWERAAKLLRQGGQK